MPVTVTGRVTDETGAVLPKLTAEGRGDWLLTTEQLARGETNAQGRFTLNLPDLLDLSDVPRSFRVRVLDFTKRPVIKDRERIGTVQTHDLGEGKMTIVRVPNNLIRDVNMSAVVLKYQSRMWPILTSGARGCG
jgi:hypothetical protein